MRAIRLRSWKRADHALAEARQAVEVLALSEEPLGATVNRVAMALAFRAGVEISVQVAGGSRRAAAGS